MKPDYPNSLPVLDTLTTSDYPQARHWNVPNREIEAICTELGTNPCSILETVAPQVAPASVAAYLDMLAYILKTMTGAAHWYNAAVPSRCQVSGHGGNATIGAGATSCLVAFSRGLIAVASIQQTKLYMPYACKLDNLRFQTESAQPGTGTMVATIFKNGATTGFTITVPAGAGGAIFGTASLGISYAAGDYFTCPIINNAAGASAQIGAWAVEFDQTG